MSAVEESNVKEIGVKDNGYNVISVTKTDPPEGIKGDNWYHYIIKRADSTIEGNRSGTLEQVTAHANEFVEELNARTGRKGTSVWAPNKKK